jgi:hypothetical protein
VIIVWRFFTRSTDPFTMPTLPSLPSPQIKRFSHWLAGAVAATLLSLGGCANLPEVRSDFDRSADFTQYRTFGFASPLGTDRQGYQSLVSQRLKAAAQRELEARGLRLDSATPQLLVNFSASLSEKTRVVSLPSLGLGYHGYRGGMYSAWPMYRDETVVTPYTEGRLNIDLVDAARQQLVWEGVVTGLVTQTAMDDMQAAIDAAVNAAFAKYPIAGSAKAR